MKTSKDPRHITRVKTMQELFSWQFKKEDQLTVASDDQEVINSEVSALSQQVIENKEKLDEFIQKAAPDWPTGKINKIDLSVLRLAIYELFFVKETPTKVIVDEAVEIAKEYGSEASGRFVNGVLGTLIEQNPDKLY